MQEKGEDFCQKLSEIIGEDPILTDETGGMTCRGMDGDGDNIPY